MTQPDWVATPYPPVHNEPPKSAQWEAMSQDQVNGLRQRLLESILQVVVQAVTGIFIPGGGVGGATGQLTSWANNLPLIGPLVAALTGSTGTLGDLGSFFNLANPVNLLSGLINGVVGGSGNPLSGLISSLLGTASTASTAGTNASTALGNWTSLFSGIPGVSSIANFLGFLQPGTGSNGIFAPLINGVIGGTTNPLSGLISSLLGTASTASTAGTNATTALGNWTTLLAGLPGVSTLASFLTFLNPGTGANGIFAPLINGVAGGTTNPLSSLISSLTGTASTASTAGTNATTALGNWTTLFAGLPSISNLTNFISFLNPGTGANGIFAPLINGVAGGTTNPLSSLISSLTGTASTASTANTNVGSLTSGLASSPSSWLGLLNDSRVPGLGSLMDGIFGGFTGATSSGATQSNVESATTSQADATAGNSALITQIQAALGAGTPDSDDFERASLGANWTFLSSAGTGTIPDAHNFHFSGTGTNEYVMRKNNIVSATDHITSTIVLNQAIPTSLLAVPPFGGNIDIWVRQTAFTTYATRTGVRLRIKSNVLTAAYTLAWVNNGTATTLDTGSCPVPAAGAILSLEAGASANPRLFVASLNGTPFMPAFIDTGLVTTIGASNRYRGFGGIGATGIGFSTGTPDIRQWTAVG